MKRFSPIALSFVAIIISNCQVFAQSTSTETRPRSVAQNKEQGAKTSNTAAIAVPAERISTPAPALNEADKRAPILLTPSVIQNRINEAQRLLKSRPLTTAKTTPSIDFVTVAALDKISDDFGVVAFELANFFNRLRGVQARGQQEAKGFLQDRQPFGREASPYQSHLVHAEGAVLAFGRGKRERQHVSVLEPRTQTRGKRRNLILGG